MNKIGKEIVLPGFEKPKIFSNHSLDLNNKFLRHNSSLANLEINEKSIYKLSQEDIYIAILKSRKELIKIINETKRSSEEKTAMTNKVNGIDKQSYIQTTKEKLEHIRNKSKKALKNLSNKQ